MLLGKTEVLEESFDSGDGAKTTLCRRIAGAAVSGLAMWKSSFAGRAAA
jgi:hypothetical protein